MGAPCPTRPPGRSHRCSTQPSDAQPSPPARGVAVWAPSHHSPLSSPGSRLPPPGTWPPPNRKPSRAGSPGPPASSDRLHLTLCIASCLLECPGLGLKARLVPASRCLPPSALSGSRQNNFTAARGGKTSSPPDPSKSIFKQFGEESRGNPACPPGVREGQRRTSSRRVSARRFLPWSPWRPAEGGGAGFQVSRRRPG